MFGIIVEMNKKIMNEVNNFASVNFRHCGKLFCFGTEEYPEGRQIADAQLLTSK